MSTAWNPKCLCAHGLLSTTQQLLAVHLLVYPLVNEQQRKTPIGDSPPHTITDAGPCLPVATLCSKLSFLLFKYFWIVKICSPEKTMLDISREMLSTIELVPVSLFFCAVVRS